MFVLFLLGGGCCRESGVNKYELLTYPVNQHPPSLANSVIFFCLFGFFWTRNDDKQRAFSLDFIL